MERTRRGTHQPLLERRRVPISVSGDDRLEILHRPTARVASTALVDGGGQFAFFGLKPDNLFLHRATGEQAVNRDRAGLADPVGAVRRLGLGRGIPPGIEVDHYVRGSEVEAVSAGLETDQENRRTIRLLELIHKLLAIPGLAIQPQILPTPAGNAFLDFQ